MTMDRNTLIFLLVAGPVLFFIWRKTEIDLVNAKSHAASVAGASSLINMGAEAIKDYYMGGAG
jgi:hypothetical protein